MVILSTYGASGFDALPRGLQTRLVDSAGRPTAFFELRNFTSANRVESETSPANEPMEAHLSVSRTLGLLAADMDTHPERIQPVDTRLIARIISLVGQVDVDLNSTLSPEDE
ncbi:type II toxin-antitoxin system PrlF family antitoxin [Pseudomonas fluorescens]|uniref:type II toxin-antitoxin system PrlF family antitoxin n=1 Tax=Pseudomonas fluorescens TaxID=294 RepID=UPI001CD52AEF|nr:type II toxin-antitoxin system PrlF family antitoxin [Pseudomonas fluorescens]